MKVKTITLSTPRSITMVREAKQNAQTITVETAPNFKRPKHPRINQITIKGEDEALAIRTAGKITTASPIFRQIVDGWV